MLRRASPTLLVLAGLAALPAPALAQSQIFRDYREDGVIDPCAYTPGQLRQGLQGLPPDVEAYVPGLGDQLRRSCVTGASPALPQQTVAGPTAAAPGAPAAPRRVAIPKPPAPEPPETRRLAGSAPTIAQSAAPGIPDWVAGLLAAALVGGLGLLVAVRYGGLELGGGGFKAASVSLGERVADGLAAIADRLRR